MKISKRKVDEAILIVQESFDSHLRCLVDPGSEVTGDPKFHMEAAREYGRVLDVLLKVRGAL